MPKEDDKGVAAVRSVLSGATVKDVATILGVSPAKLSQRLREAFAAGVTQVIKDSNKKRKKKGSK